MTQTQTLQMAYIFSQPSGRGHSNPKFTHGLHFFPALWPGPLKPKIYRCLHLFPALWPGALKPKIYRWLTFPSPLARCTQTQNLQMAYISSQPSGRGHSNPKFTDGLHFFPALWSGASWSTKPTFTFFIWHASLHKTITPPPSWKQ